MTLVELSPSPPPPVGRHKFIVARASPPASKGGVSPPSKIWQGRTPLQFANEDARATLFDALGVSNWFTLVVVFVMELTQRLANGLRAQGRPIKARRGSRTWVAHLHCATRRKIGLQRIPIHQVGRGPDDVIGLTGTRNRKSPTAPRPLQI